MAGTTRSLSSTRPSSSGPRRRGRTGMRSPTRYGCFATSGRGSTSASPTTPTGPLTARSPATRCSPAASWTSIPSAHFPTANGDGSQTSSLRSSLRSTRSRNRPPREFGVSEPDPRKDLDDLRRDIEALVLPRLAPHEVPVVRAFLAEMAAESRSVHPTTLIHGDLSGEHVLWDAENQQVNIIDFSDRSIGDPAARLRRSPCVRERVPRTGPEALPRAQGSKGRRGGRGCTSDGGHWKQWSSRSKAIHAPSRKAAVARSFSTRFEHL